MEKRLKELMHTMAMIQTNGRIIHEKNNVLVTVRCALETRNVEFMIRAEKRANDFMQSIGRARK